MGLNDFGKSAKELSRNPLGIIGLFLVLVYGLAALVTTSNSLNDFNKTALIIFLVIFPIIVLIVFYKLVTKHSNKLYAPSDFTNEENFMKAIESGINKSNKFNDLEALTQHIRKEITEQPIYRYTKLQEEGKVLILTLDKGMVKLDDFAKERKFDMDAVLRQARILEQFYEWIRINENIAEITDKGKQDLNSFSDFVYSRWR